MTEIATSPIKKEKDGEKMYSQSHLDMLEKQNE